MSWTRIPDEACKEFGYTLGDEWCPHGCNRPAGTATKRVCIQCDYPPDANIIMQHCEDAACNQGRLSVMTWHYDGKCLRCEEAGR